MDRLGREHPRGRRRAADLVTLDGLPSLNQPSPRFFIAITLLNFNFKSDAVYIHDEPQLYCQSSRPVNFGVNI